ncbi:hypothetical protein [Streptomyces sp. NPDC054901]
MMKEERFDGSAVAVSVWCGSRFRRVRNRDRSGITLCSGTEGGPRAGGCFMPQEQPRSPEAAAYAAKLLEVLQPYLSARQRTGRILAAGVNVAASTLSRYCHGERLPDPAFNENLQRFLSGMDLPIPADQYELLRSLHAGAQSARGGLAHQLAAKKQQVRALEAEHAALTATNQQLQEQLERQTQDFASRQDASDRQLRSAAVLYRETLAELEAARRDLAAVRRKHADNLRMLGELGRLRDIEALAAKQRHALNAAQLLIREQEEDLDQYRAQNAELTREVTTLQRQNLKLVQEREAESRQEREAAERRQEWEAERREERLARVLLRVEQAPDMVSGWGYPHGSGPEGWDGIPTEHPYSERSMGILRRRWHSRQGKQSSGAGGAE